MPCSLKEKLKCSRLHCHLMSKVIMYSPASPFHQVSCLGWDPLPARGFSGTAGKPPRWPGRHQPGEPAAVRNSLGWLCSAFTVVTAIFSCGDCWSSVFIRKRSQIPGTSNRRCCLYNTQTICTALLTTTHTLSATW